MPVSYVDDTAFGVAVAGVKPGIIDVQRRAIGAQNLVVGSHIEEYVRVIERRSGAHAVEFLDAGEHLLGAGIVT